MKEFEVEIQEFLAKVVKVDAENISDAIDKIKKKYFNTEIVLDYNDFVEVNFVDINKQGKEGKKYLLTRKIIDYLYYDEKKHFEESGKPENHIYRTIKALDSLLD